MEFKQIIQRALEVRSKYSELERKKYGKEWNNGQIAQGFVGDVGSLMKLVMAKEGIRDMEDVDKKLAHELADCLWSVLVLANKYGVDIEKSFLDTMNDLDKRIDEKIKL